MNWRKIRRKIIAVFAPLPPRYEFFFYDCRGKKRYFSVECRSGLKRAIQLAHKRMQSNMAIGISSNCDFCYHNRVI